MCKSFAVNIILAPISFPQSKRGMPFVSKFPLSVNTVFLFVVCVCHLSEGRVAQAQRNPMLQPPPQQDSPTVVHQTELH